MSINIDFLRDSQDYSKYVKYLECDLEHLTPITGEDLDKIKNKDGFELNYVFQNEFGNRKYGVYVEGDNQKLYKINFGER